MMMMMMISKLFNFISFFIFFFFIFLLGCVKGLIIGAIALGIIGVGNAAVVVGLWPAHFIWTYFCVAKSRRIGWVLKSAAFVLLPLPLVLWPIVAVLGSVLGGSTYGFFAPLAATFVAVGGEGAAHKFYHCVFDGSLSTVKGSLTVVSDFTDFCFYSYFSYMDELCEDVHPDEEPVDIVLSKIPSCLLVSVIAIPVDVPLITAVAIWKSPFLWYKGWKRLSEDLIGREGPFSETVCVPFAALTILLWPLAVVGFVIASFISSFFLAMYSGIVVHQEDSFRLGLAYILAAVSLFDEYTNDLFDMREGPRYRRNTSSNNEEDGLGNNSIDQQCKTEEAQSSKMGSRQSKEGVKKFTPMQVWDWLFKLCEVNGKTLLRDGVIDVKDIVDFIVKGKCNKLVMKLPAFVILECLLESAKSNSDGFIMLDGVELTKINWPKNIIFEWFAGPLLIMKEQIKNFQMDDEEENCLKKLIMCCPNDRPDEWDNIGFPSQDAIKRAQLQAIIRRLRGIVGSISRIPTFRRRFTTLVKQLYAEANQIGLRHTEGVPSSSHGNDDRCSNNADIV